MTSTPWELGSDFDWSLEPVGSARAEPPPWEREADELTYVESGRQALALVSQDLRNKGFQRLLMPGHFCHSMVDPFVADGWLIDFYGYDDVWTALAPHDALPSPETTAVFSFAAFGVRESPDWLEFLREGQSRGAVVISDETHRLLSKGLAEADLRIASLRKMLPVPDGAFVTGLSVRPRLNEGGRQAAVRTGAMVEKAKYLRGELRQSSHLSMFARAEELTDREAAPARMSDTTAGRLAELDYAAMRSSRIANHSALTRGLAASEYRVTTTAAEVASHAVIAGPEVPRLRRHLIESRIFCPIHWVAPDGGPRPRAWRSDVLSIPIDHRYSPDDLTRVARAIQQHDGSRGE